MARLIWAIEQAAGAILVVMMVAATVQVVARFFGVGFAWTDETARYGMIWMTFLGSAALIGWGGHISINIVIDAVPRPVEIVLRVFVAAVVLACILAIGWLALQLTQRPTVLNQRTPMMGIPMLWVYLALPISICLMIVVFLGTLKQQLAGRQASAIEEEML